LRVLTKGESVFLFPAGFNPEEDEYLSKGLIRNSKFTLHFIARKNKMTTTVSFYTVTIEELLNRYPNFKILSHLSKMKLSELLGKSHEFYGIPKDVVSRSV
jgi:hypothetical protein